MRSTAIFRLAGSLWASAFHGDGTSGQKTGWEAIRPLGKHHAGNGWLEGGRSSLLESRRELRFQV